MKRRQLVSAKKFFFDCYDYLLRKRAEKSYSLISLSTKNHFYQKHNEHQVKTERKRLNALNQKRKAHATRAEEQQIM